MIDKKELIKNGVHFGHQTSKWCPKMKPYIWGYKNNVHLIDVSKTAEQLEKATKFLETIASSGKPILLVGTKKAAQDIIYKIAKELNLPYVNYRWIGGTFSNFRQVKKSVANYLHYKDVLEKSGEFNYTKKELSLIQKKFDRLNKNVGGIVQLTWPVGAVVVVDVNKEHVCVKEAQSCNIPIVAIVDTNSDPSNIDYVIPANDDVSRSIEVLLNYMAQGIKKGQEEVKNKREEAANFEFEAEGSGPDISVLEDDLEDEEEKPKKAANSGNKSSKKPVKKPFYNKSRKQEDRN